MFKALFAFIGFGLTALGIWLLNPIVAGTGIIFLLFVIWWIRSTRSA